MTDATIMIRIKKLLALSSSPNQAEAEAAMAKAMELMTRHNLDQATIDAHAREQEDPFRKADGILVPKMTIDDRLIVGILERHFSVKVVWVQRYNSLGRKESVLTFIGRASAIEVATYLHGFLKSTFAQLFKSYCKAQGFRLNAAGLRESYYRGLATGLHEKLAAERARVQAEAPAVQQAGLVLAEDAARLNEALALFFPRMVQSKHRAPSHLNHGAMDAGKQDASGIAMRQGMTGGRAPLQLT